MQSTVTDKRTRFKTFFGKGFNRASDSANMWLEKNPNIEIVDFRFSSDKDSHAICVMYKEFTNEN